MVIGDVKGDDRVAALLPWDLTLVLGGVLVAGIILNFLRKKRGVAMPPAYFLFVALVALMVASLSYTPVLDAGSGKTGPISDGDGHRDRRAIFLFWARRRR